MKASCVACGKPFEAKRSTAKYCGATCRKRQSRKPEPAKVTPIPIPPRRVAPPLVEATRADLEAVGKLDTMLGQQAMRLAERLCGEFDTGSALAALSKELRAVMAEVMAGATPKADALDELAARRVRKAAGG